MTISRRALVAGAFVLHPALAMAMAPGKLSVAGFPATLADPRGTGPLLVMVAGSGPTDRDGNSVLGVTASYLRKLADALAAYGLASLRYDKRGVAGGIPPGPEESVVFDTFVDDLVTVLDASAAAFPGRPVVLAGHSEGGLVAMRAARRRNVAGLVLLATPGRPPADVLREQIIAGLAGPLRDEALAALDILARNGRVEQVSPELFALFRPSAQNFLASMLALDPAADLAGLDCPALVLGGGSDIQVLRADFDRLVAARPALQSRWFDHMNHVLVDAPADRMANIATYADPDRPLSEGLAQCVADFVATLA